MKRPRRMASNRVAVPISIQPIVANGDAMIIVFFLPTYCSRKPASRLPRNAPVGGIEPARRTMASWIKWWCAEWRKSFITCPRRSIFRWQQNWIVFMNRWNGWCRIPADQSNAKERQWCAQWKWGLFTRNRRNKIFKFECVYFISSHDGTCRNTGFCQIFDEVFIFRIEMR